MAWINLLAVIRAWAGAAVSHSSAWTCCHSQPLLGHRWGVYSNLKKACNKVVLPSWSHPCQRPFPFLGYCGSLLPSASHLYQLKWYSQELVVVRLCPRRRGYTATLLWLLRAGRSERPAGRWKPAPSFMWNGVRICPCMKFSREKLGLPSHSCAPCHSSQPGANLHGSLKAWNNMQCKWNLCYTTPQYWCQLLLECCHESQGKQVQW